MIVAVSAVALVAFWAWLSWEVRRRRMVLAVEVTGCEVARLRRVDRVVQIQSGRRLVVWGLDLRRDVVWLRD